MSGLEAEQPEVPPTVLEWYGLYPGTVVSTEDPEKRGHVRVRVPQVYGDPDTEDEFIPDKSLPWAKPIMPVHDFHADFEVGDGVWVSFWGGRSSEPIWHGQFLGVGDAPDEFTSSYGPRPQTRIIRTTNGHLIEMRWVDGEERIRIRTAGGIVIDMLDSVPSVTVETPGGLKFSLDDDALKAVIETATSKIEVDDSGPGLVNIHSAGSINIGSVSAGKLAAVLAPFLAKYDIHTHLYIPPLHPLPAVATAGPVPVSVPADVTSNVVLD